MREGLEEKSVRIHELKYANWVTCVIKIIYDKIENPNLHFFANLVKCEFHKMRIFKMQIS